MKSYSILLPVFLLALFQGVFLPLNFVLLVVLVWAVIRPPKEGLIVAFFSGIFLDLAKGSPLGMSSSIFLVASFILHLYSRRFDPAHPAFLAVFVLLTSIIYNLISKEPWYWLEGVILFLLALLTRPAISLWQEKEKGIKLKINR